MCRSRQEDLAEGRLQRRKTPSLRLRGNTSPGTGLHASRSPSVCRPPDTMLSMDRSTGAHGQPSTGKHPQEFLTHSSGRRRDLYSNVASSDLGGGKSHFNNEQDQEEVIKHGPRKVEAGKL